MKKQLITKQAMNNRANQLNPNNEAYWKSRMGNNQNMAKPLGKKTANQNQDPFWKVEYQSWDCGWENRNKIFVGKMQAIAFANSLQTDNYRNVKINKYYL